MKGSKGLEAPTMRSTKLRKRGRKTNQESHAAEFRQKLVIWKQTPVFLRPSLRELARQLGTSHQMLTHCLKGLEKWQAKEDWRRMREIYANARAENRPLTPYEAREAEAYNRRATCRYVGSVLRDQLEQLKQEARRGPLNHYQIKMLKLLARNFPEAQELLPTCSQGSLKKKSFRKIVMDTPRLEGESNVAWVRRIWDECVKYGARCPQVIRVERLEKWSR